MPRKVKKATAQLLFIIVAMLLADDATNMPLMLIFRRHADDTIANIMLYICRLDYYYDTCFVAVYFRH